MSKLNVHTFEPFSNRRGDRPLQRDLVGFDRVYRLLRENVVETLVERARAGGNGHPINGKPGGVEHLPGAGGHFRAYPVTGEKNDRMLCHVMGMIDEPVAAAKPLGSVLAPTTAILRFGSEIPAAGSTSTAGVAATPTAAEVPTAAAGVESPAGIGGTSVKATAATSTTAGGVAPTRL